MSKRRTPLAPAEVATGGILAGLSIALGLAGTVIPVLSIFFTIGSTIPIAMITAHMRPRASLGTALITILMSLAVGGIQSAQTVAQAVAVGLVVGYLARKEAHRAFVYGAALLLGIAGGALTWLLLLVLSESRNLVLESLRTTTNGYIALIGKIPALAPQTDAVQAIINTWIEHWYYWIPPLGALGIFVLTLVAHWLTMKVLRRITITAPWDPLVDTANRERTDTPTTPDPFPISLRDVTFTYPGSDTPALRGITLDISDGFTVIAGPNGSGKSTLSLVLAGAQPTSGQVIRPGGVGLGDEAGTAVVAQRSELQFLGDTVAEDIAWGMSDDERASLDLPELLHTVGLEGLEDASPRRLSGGQLQRLSLAGALARKPRVLISDESTAMIDSPGRRELLEVLHGLPALGTSVIHITHDATEASSADTLIRLRDGHIDTSDAPDPLEDTYSQVTPVIERSIAVPQPYQGGSIDHLWVKNVGHAYDVGSPWENTVLSDVSFIVSPGQALLITGENGSGKSTLARILTGLMRPTWGECTLGGSPVSLRVGDVGLARQFARLQLQRPTVAKDILAAAKVGAAVGSSDSARRHRGASSTLVDSDQLVAKALAEVGLPGDLASRNVDDLSGGQMRRVALAGVLASHPKVLVLDEPFAGLDVESRRLLSDVLRKRRADGLGLIIISHDTDELIDLVDNHLHLAQGVIR